MDQLLKDGVVRRGYLGVQIRELDAGGRQAARAAAGQGGVLVRRSSRARRRPRAGCRRATSIIDDRRQGSRRTAASCRRVVADLPLGKPVEVTVVRDGKPRPLSVTIEEQPDDLDELANRTPRLPPRSTPKGEVQLEKLGLEVSDTNAELAEQFGFREDVEGAFVTQVEVNSPAFVAGLRKGMIIRKVNKQAVASGRRRPPSRRERGARKGHPDAGPTPGRTAGVPTRQAGGLSMVDRTARVASLQGGRVPAKERSSSPAPVRLAEFRPLPALRDTHANSAIRFTRFRK